MDKSISIYKKNNILFVVPYASLDNTGLLTAVTPVYKSDLKDLNSLADALGQAYERAGRILPDTQRAWKTEIRKELERAEATCSVEWNDERSIEIIPQKQEFSDEPDLKAKIGWVDVEDAIVELPFNTDFQTIAEKVSHILSTP